jgi:undecaprenyl-diphosphatase
VRLAGTAVAGFVALAVAVALGLTRAIDAAALDATQLATSPLADVVGSLLTLAGRFEVTAVVALALALAASRRGGLAGAVPLLLFVTVAVELALKLLVPQPLPPSTLSRDLELFAGPSVDTPFAFPSGHQLRATFLATLVTPPRLPWLAVSIAFVAAMALSRVYLGQHWPSDVVGGLLLGLAFGIPARRPYFDAWRRAR